MPPNRVISRRLRAVTLVRMNTLTAFSDAIADAVASVAPSVVQVHGRRRPASGLVQSDDLGTDDGARAGA